MCVINVVQGDGIAPLVQTSVLGKGVKHRPPPIKLPSGSGGSSSGELAAAQRKKHPVSTHPVDTRSETQNGISSLIHRAIYYSFCTAVSYCLIGSTVKSRVDETCCWKSCVIEPWMAEGENFWAASVVVLWFIAIANVWKGQAFGTVLQSTQSSYKNIQE